MSEVLLSVLIPTFRRNGDLAEALESVLGNGFSGELEVVVTDDDPAGGAGGVVAARADARLRHVVHPHGPDKPRNWQYGIGQTRGKYVFKLDDDDLIRPGFLQKTVALLEANPQVGSVYSGYEELDVSAGAGEVVVDRDFFAKGIVPGHRYVRAVLVNDGGYPRNQKTTAVFRRELAARMDFYRWASDDFSFSAALAVEADVGYVPEPLYVWRKHGANSSADLHAVWRVARESLDGLEQLPTVAGQPELACDWPGLIERCRQALPIYYLQASLRLHGSAATWKLWRQFREEGAVRDPWRGWAVVLPGVLLPRAAHRWAMERYVASPTLQRLARRVLTRG